MMYKYSFKLCIIFLLFCFTCSAQSICDKTGPIKTNAQLQTKIYENLVSVYQDSAKLGTDPFKADYSKVQKEFNNIYASMRDNLGLFKRKKTVCEKYSNELKVAIEHGKKLNDKMSSALGRNGAGFGIAELLPLIEWLWNTGKDFEDARKDTFYHQIEWQNYDDVVSGKATSPLPPAKLNNASTSKKEEGK